MRYDHFPQCPGCKQHFSAPKAKQVYCSRSCRTGKPSEFDSPKYDCAECGVMVVGRKLQKKRTGGDADRMFCSRDCYDTQRAREIENRRKACRHCGAGFDPGADERLVYCSHTCRVDHKRATPRGCVSCGYEFIPIKYRRSDGRTQIITCNAGKTCSAGCQVEWIKTNPERIRKISEAFTGPKHPNWQGGTHRLGNRGPGWQKIAEECRERHGRKCKHCSMPEEESIRRGWGRLQVNHIVPFHQQLNKERANKQSNLEALCKSCHTKADWEWRKSNPVQCSLDIFEGRG